MPRTLDEGFNAETLVTPAKHIITIVGNDVLVALVTNTANVYHALLFMSAL